MALADDILERIRSEFSSGEMLPVIDLLTGLQKKDPRLFCDRILRCSLYVAGGEFDKLAAAVELARLDFRDLIVAAEYDGYFGSRQRDLSLPFVS
jgi:hypothetical protein